jgi:hypothetical protein
MQDRGWVHSLGSNSVVGVAAMDLFFQFAIVAISVGCPIAWFISEFKAKRQIRLLLGVASILGILGMMLFLVSFARYGYDDSYGYANQSLIEISIEGIRNGKAEIVASKLQQLLDEYQHPYGSKSHYDDLIRRYVSEIQSNIRTPKLSYP